ncbi:MAG: putative Se/S carrier-like protein [Oscillospiraceae bacterium]
MKKQLIVLSSITYAYKAKNYLQSKGITVYVERATDFHETKGCGYGIAVREDAYRIADMLSEVGIKVRDIKIE